MTCRNQLQTGDVAVALLLWSLLLKRPLSWWLDSASTHFCNWGQTPRLEVGVTYKTAPWSWRSWLMDTAARQGLSRTECLRGSKKTRCRLWDYPDMISKILAFLVFQLKKEKHSDCLHIANSKLSSFVFKHAFPILCSLIDLL